MRATSAGEGRTGRNRRYVPGGRLVLLAMVGVLCIPLAAGLAGCGGPGGTGDGGDTVRAEVLSGPLPERINRLAFKLLGQVGGEEPGKNLFLSPASLEMALAMTMNGAAGDTLTEMRNALELTGMSVEEVNASNKAMAEWLGALDPKVTLEIANSLWAREGVEFSPEFLAANREYYDARVESIDFSLASAAKTINSWVSEQTRGKIKEMVEPPIDSRTILFLLNAIYFKGQWAKQFDKGRTKEADFHAPQGTGKVPMMSREGEFRYMENDDFQAIFLPYGAGKTGMYVFLPSETSDLETFIGSLTPENWNRWMAGFSESEGEISMPRFKLEYEKALKETLTAMGMGVAFTEQADFSKMLAEGSTDRPFIQQVKQKTYADVNEEGTEAAAVTSVEVGVTSIAPDGTFEMRVDRPFFFAIGDEAGKVILFEGAVHNP